MMRANEETVKIWQWLFSLVSFALNPFLWPFRTFVFFGSRYLFPGLSVVFILTVCVISFNTSNKYLSKHN